MNANKNTEELNTPYGKWIGLQPLELYVYRSRKERVMSRPILAYNNAYVIIINTLHVYAFTQWEVFS